MHDYDDELVTLNEEAITPAEAALFRALAGVRFSSDARLKLQGGYVIDGDEITKWIKHFENEENS